MRISDWSSDVCSSDLVEGQVPEDGEVFRSVVGAVAGGVLVEGHVEHPMEAVLDGPVGADGAGEAFRGEAGGGKIVAGGGATAVAHGLRSEEHTSELQSLMRISYAVFCLKKKKKE